MKLAVLMSTYNGEKYLREQIDSILNQEKKFEMDLIVRDDGSVDNTQKILEEYASKGKLVWYTGDNLKPAHSFWDLLKKHDGYDYYAFADQDDVWDKDKISIAVSNIKDVPNIPCLYCSNAQLVDDKLEFLGRNVYKKIPKTDFYTLTCAGGLLGCTMVLNAALANVIQQKKVPEKMVLHDFFVSVLCTALNGKIFYDPLPRMKYRQHANNVVGVSNGFLKKIANRFSDITKKAKVSVAEQAFVMLNDYENEITQDKRVWLKTVADYRKSLLGRLRISCSGKTKYVSYNMAFKLRMSLLLGNR